MIPLTIVRRVICKLAANSRNSHIAGYERDLPADEEREAHEARATCLRRLGIDPETIVWPAAPGVEEVADEGLSLPGDVGCLSDEEWALLAPFLPLEAPQVSAMGNRSFLDAVLAAMQRGGAWTSRATTSAEIEAVRRRFGRWAHQGTFQALREALPRLDVSPEHQRLLGLAAQRAASLKARGSTRERAPAERPSVAPSRA